MNERERWEEARQIVKEAQATFDRGPSFWVRSTLEKLLQAMTLMIADHLDAREPQRAGHGWKTPEPAGKLIQFRQCIALADAVRKFLVGYGLLHSVPKGGSYDVCSADLVQLRDALADFEAGKGRRESVEVEVECAVLKNVLRNLRDTVRGYEVESYGHEVLEAAMREAGEALGDGLGCWRTTKKEGPDPELKLERVYTVKEDDTLHGIAKRFGVTNVNGPGYEYLTLAALNRIERPEFIKPGWRIIIPESKKESSK